MLINLFESSEKKQMKAWEQQQQAQEQLAQLSETEKAIEKMINEFYDDAKERLMDNDEDGFELIANSVFYFQDMKKVVQTIRIQFQTFIKTSEITQKIDDIRPILRKTADMMNSLPSMDKNNKDFMKFKKGLMRGQLNMKAMGSMMTSINPATSSTRSKSEFDSLKDRLMMSGGNTASPLNVATKPQEPKSVISGNEDFFNAINSD